MKKKVGSNISCLAPLVQGEESVPPTVESVRFWSDFNSVYYHPRSIVQLYQYEINSPLRAFENHLHGRDLFHSIDKVRVCSLSSWTSSPAVQKLSCRAIIRNMTYLIVTFGHSLRSVILCKEFNFSQRLMTVGVDSLQSILRR